MADNLAVNESAVTALKQMREELETQTQELKTEINTLKEAFETNRQGLGPHDASIRLLLDALGDTSEEAGKPVKKLVLKLDAAAALRSQIMQNNRYHNANAVTDEGSRGK